ncbi:hypothetical protein RF11_15166 [Thelohanellus kitauei]|uniref:CCHC-type domain-containing protein n=1 Tax=Thelohanellus kitauei TaxID=669202 RepID=A0A0C2JTD7_THEKT|nr:hypothetical protein RF11_15166 [Thelohanellus kitauei]
MTSNRFKETGGKFEPFVPAIKLWKEYLSRFRTFTGANLISDHRLLLTFLTNQSKEIFHLLKTAASQMNVPKDVNDLSWDEILEMMGTNFNSKTFVVGERHRFYTEIKRKSGETIQELASRVREKATTCDFPGIKDPLDEALKTVFICSVNNEAILKAIFHKSSNELSFSEVVEIAAEVEEASHSAKAQMSSIDEVAKVSTSKVHVPGKTHYRKSFCHTCGKLGHAREECRYRDRICNFCKIKGHLEKACRKKNYRTSSKNLTQFDVRNIVSTINQKLTLHLFLGKNKLQFELRFIRELVLSRKT